jgi:hypothetical protein
MAFPKKDNKRRDKKVTMLECEGQDSRRAALETDTRTIGGVVLLASAFRGSRRHANQDPRPKTPFTSILYDIRP